MGSTSNGALLAGGWGGMNVNVLDLNHGVTYTSTRASARYRKTVYPIHVTNSEFSVELEFAGYDNFKKFTEWMEGYMRALAEGSAFPMRVYCPARDFDEVGVPLSIPFGDEATKYVYDVTLSFTSSEDPRGTTSEGGSFLSRLFNVETFSQAYGTNVDPEINFMLPYGYQLTVWDPGSNPLPPLPGLPEVPPTPPLPGSFEEAESVTKALGGPIIGLPRQ